MSSGVKVHDDIKTVFNTDMKLHKKYRYLLFGFEDNSKMDEIVILKRAEPSATYQDFCEDMTAAANKGEGRFAVYDYHYEGKDGQKKEKLVFFHWSPDNEIKLRQKMVYASSKDYIKAALGQGSIQLFVQANDFSDLQLKGVEDELRKSDR